MYLYLLEASISAACNPVWAGECPASGTTTNSDFAHLYIKTYNRNLIAIYTERVFEAHINTILQISLILHGHELLARCL